MLFHMRMLLAGVSRGQIPALTPIIILLLLTVLLYIDTHTHTHTHTWQKAQCTQYPKHTVTGQELVSHSERLCAETL